MFWELWSFVAATCHAFECTWPIWPDMWAGTILPLHRAWYAAFHDLLAWILSFSRTSAWLLMRKHHGRDIRNKDLLIILLRPVNCLNSLSLAAAPPTTVLAHVSILPNNFLPLLCCIVSEVFGSVAPLVSRDQPTAGAAAAWYKQAFQAGYGFNIHTDNLLSWVVALCYNLAIEDESTGCTGHFAFLAAPSVVHCLKVILILPRKPLLEAAHRKIVQASAECLDMLLSRCCVLRDAGLVDSTPFSETSMAANRDAMGLPVHLNPFLSRAALETDVRVLHVLSKHLEGGALGDGGEDLPVTAYSVQVLILQDWMCAGRPDPSPAGAAGVMMGGVVGLAERCSLLGLQFLLEQLGEGCGSDMQLLSQREQQRRRAQHTSAVARNLRLAALGFFESVRRLLFFASHFRICTLDGGLGSGSSECIQAPQCFCETMA